MQMHRKTRKQGWIGYQEGHAKYFSTETFPSRVQNFSIMEDPLCLVSIMDWMLLYEGKNVLVIRDPETLRAVFVITKYPTPPGRPLREGSIKKPDIFEKWRG